MTAITALEPQPSVPHPSLDPRAYRWVQGGSCKDNCSGAVLVPSFDIPADADQRASDHAWLTKQLTDWNWNSATFCTALHPEASDPANFYAGYVQLQVEDARPDRAGQMVYVMRYWYSQAALTHDAAALREEVRAACHRLVTHEVDEWLRNKGQAVSFPHGAS